MNKQYIKIHDGLYLDLSKAGEKSGHKYYKRVPKPTGKGYNYFYTKQQFKDYKEKGIVPGEKKGGILSGIMSFFGFKDEAKAQEKVKQVYESNKKDLSGVSVKTFTDHMNEYLGNKDKWDAKFVKNQDKKTGESVPKTDKPKSEKDKSGVMSTGGQKWDISLMKKIAGFVGSEKKESVKEKEKQSDEGNDKGEFGNIHKPRELTDDQIENAIEKMSKLSLKELRRNQDLMDQQIEMAHKQKKGSDTFESLETHREIYTAAVAVREFKDNPKEWINTVRSISERYKEYEEQNSKKKSADNFDTIPEGKDKSPVMSGKGVDLSFKRDMSIKSNMPTSGYDENEKISKIIEKAYKELKIDPRQIVSDAEKIAKHDKSSTLDKVHVLEAISYVPRDGVDIYNVSPIDVFRGSDYKDKMEAEAFPGGESLHRMSQVGVSSFNSKKYNELKEAVNVLKNNYEKLPKNQKEYFKIKFSREKMDAAGIKKISDEIVGKQSDKNAVMSGESAIKDIHGKQVFVSSKNKWQTIDVGKTENGNYRVQIGDLMVGSEDTQQKAMDKFFQYAKDNNISIEPLKEKSKSIWTEYLEWEKKKQPDKREIMSGEVGATDVEKSTSKLVASDEPGIFLLTIGGDVAKDGNGKSAKIEKTRKGYNFRDGETLFVDRTMKEVIDHFSKSKSGKASFEINKSYIDSLPPMKRGKLREALDHKYRTDKGAKSMREMIQSGDYDRVEEMDVSGNVFDRTKYNRMSGEEQADYEKKMAQKKKSYAMYLKGGTSFISIPKMVYDALTSKPLQKASSIGPKIESEHKGTVDFITKHVKEHGTMPKATEVYRLIAKDHESEIKDYYTRLVEMEKQANVKRPKIEMDVIKFLVENPNPNDDKVHAFAEKMKINPHDIEKVFYKLATSTAKMEKDTLTKATDALFGALEKAKELPVGTVSKGYKKVAKGKWVKVGKGKGEKKPDEKKPEKKPGKDEKKPEKNGGLDEEKRGIMKSALKKVANILAEALSGKDVNAPTGAAVEQTGENIKGMAKKSIKPEAEKPKKQEGNKK